MFARIRIYFFVRAVARKHASALRAIGVQCGWARTQTEYAAEYGKYVALYDRLSPLVCEYATILAGGKAGDRAMSHLYARLWTKCYAGECQGRAAREQSRLRELRSQAA